MKDSEAAADSTVSETKVLRSGKQFESLLSTLHLLRESERLTDLVFVCHWSSKKGDKVTVRYVRAHSDMVLGRSDYLRGFVDRAAAGNSPSPCCQQFSVYVTLPDTDPTLVEAILECVYLGESSQAISKKDKDAVLDLAKRLGMNLSLEGVPVETTTTAKGEERSDSAETKVRTAAMRKDFAVAKDASSPAATPPRAQTPPQEVAKGQQQQQQQKEEDKNGEKMKKRAKSADDSKRSRADDEDEKEARGSPAENGTDDVSPRVLDSSPEAPQQPQQQTRPNPLFAGSAVPKPAPQKRRRIPEDQEDRKKEEELGRLNDVKKMRPDESSSEVDSDALDERRKEISPATAASATAVSRRSALVSSDSEDESAERPRSKRKPHSVSLPSASKQKRSEEEQHKIKKGSDGDEEEEEEPQSKRNPFCAKKDDDGKETAIKREEIEKENLPRGKKSADPGDEAEVKAKEAKMQKPEVEAAATATSDNVIKRKISAPGGEDDDAREETPSSKKISSVGGGGGERTKEDSAKPETPKVKRPSKSRRPGPKSKTKRRDSGSAGPDNKKAANAAPTSSATSLDTANKEKSATAAGATSDIFFTEEIQTCPKCGGFFVNEKGLEDHMKRVHTGAMSGDDDAAKKGKKQSPGARLSLSPDSDSSDSEDDRRKREKKESSRHEEKKKETKSSSSSSKKIRKEEKRPKKIVAPSSSSESEKECDSPAPDRRKSGKFFVKLKEKSAEGLLGSPGSTPKAKARPKEHSSSSSATKTPQPHRRQSTTGNGSLPSSVMYKCNFCPESSEKVSNIRNHSLNHFKEQLMKDLPAVKPFACPLCQAPSRDKITLMRHYAFTHRKIYEHVGESELAGTRVSASDWADKSSGSGRQPESSSKKQQAKKPPPPSPDEDKREKKKRKDKARGAPGPKSSKPSSSSAAVADFSDDSDSDEDVKTKKTISQISKTLLDSD